VELYLPFSNTSSWRRALATGTLRLAASIEISSHGKPTVGGHLSWGLSVGLIILHRKVSVLRNFYKDLGTTWVTFLGHGSWSC
jgi:hypothetical protein